MMLESRFWHVLETPRRRQSSGGDWQGVLWSTASAADAC